MSDISDLILTLSPEDGSTIGNGAMLALLREHMPDLAEDDYIAARDALIDEGVLGRGKGRGGSIFRVTDDLGDEDDDLDEDEDLTLPVYLACDPVGGIQVVGLHRDGSITQSSSFDWRDYDGITKEMLAQLDLVSTELH